LVVDMMYTVQYYGSTVIGVKVKKSIVILSLLMLFHL